MDAIGIIREVAARYGVSPDVLRGKTLTYQLLHARREVYRRLRDERKMSYSRIGRIMGGRDHSTILGALRFVARIRASDVVDRVAADNGISVMTLQFHRGRTFCRLRAMAGSELRDMGIPCNEIARLLGGFTRRHINRQTNKFAEARTS